MNDKSADYEDYGHEIMRNDIQHDTMETTLCDDIYDTVMHNIRPERSTTLCHDIMARHTTPDTIRQSIKRLI